MDARPATFPAPSTFRSPRSPTRSDGSTGPAIEALFRKAGVKPGDTVVAYCHVGQQATAVIFAARLLGHPVRAL